MTRRRRGANAIEFAFVLPVLLLVLIGILDWGWYMYRWMNFELAANRGARIASGTIDDPGGAAVDAACATLEAYGTDCTDVVRYEVPGGTLEPAGRVVLEAPFDPLIGFVPTPTVLRASASTEWYGYLYEDLES